jgi:hypothetical protein
MDHCRTCFGITPGSCQDTCDLLPQVRVAHTNELRLMIESRHWYSLGIGLTDAHLIASVFLNQPTLLWTRDKQLRKIAESLGVHAKLR